MVGAESALVRVPISVSSARKLFGGGGGEKMPRPGQYLDLVFRLMRPATEFDLVGLPVFRISTASS